MEYTREKLIELCERGIVQHYNWHNRDSSSAQLQIGKAWALLKAGCDFKFDDGHHDPKTIWITIYYTDFTGFEYGLYNNEHEHFYIPSELSLKNANGNDWY